MIIAKHREGGIYGVYYTGLMKMEDGRWDDAVVYKRLPFELKPDEKTDMIYVRSKESFRSNFEHVMWPDFFALAGDDFELPPLSGTFSGIFG